MAEMQKIAESFVRFMRGNYRLDEVPGTFYDVKCLKFRQGQKTIVSVNFRKDCYEFQIVLGKAEREKFEAVRQNFLPFIQEYYDNSKNYHDGKWLFIRVHGLNELEEIKKLILLKKKPNRKPLPKENAVYSKCGHRCDLCVHSNSITEEFRQMLIPHLHAVYGDDSDWSMRCDGCGSNKDWQCDAMKCMQEKCLSCCHECEKYPCGKSTVGYKSLEARAISADDVTWAILPYVPWQYEK